MQRARDGRRYRLRTIQQVGRDAECSLRLDSRHVSNLHACIRWSESGWTVRDLGSRNGTFLDGERISVGIDAYVARNATLAFGDPEEPWSVVDNSSPRVAALAMDTGVELRPQDGLIAIPNRRNPVVVIYEGEDGWQLESDGGVAALEDGTSFEADGHSWRFQLPSDAVCRTVSLRVPALDHERLRLRFRVSADEEHVGLWVASPDGFKDLGIRSCYYLALTLARQRLTDQADGLLEHGWVELPTLLKQLPDYSNLRHLNVDIFRLRQCIARARPGLQSQIIERRRKQIRIGTEKLEIERFH